MEYLNMNGRARYILVAEEVQGKGVSAYFVYDRQRNQIERMVKSRFIGLAARDNIVNARETGGTLLGLQMPLKSLTRYNKDGTIASNGLPETQVIEFVLSNIDNSVYKIVAKYAYNKKIVAYMLEDTNKQQVKVNSNRMYALFNKGKLPGYTVTKALDDVVVSGGNIKEIPTYDVDYNGNIITETKEEPARLLTKKTSTEKLIDEPGYKQYPGVGKQSRMRKVPKEDLTVTGYIQCPWCEKQYGFVYSDGSTSNRLKNGIMIKDAAVRSKVCDKDREAAAIKLKELGCKVRDINSLGLSVDNFRSLSDYVNCVREKLTGSNTIKVVGATLGLDANGNIKVQEYAIIDGNGQKLNLDLNSYKKFQAIGAELSTSEADIILGLSKGDTLGLELKIKSAALSKIVHLVWRDTTKSDMEAINKVVGDRGYVRFEVLERTVRSSSDSKYLDMTRRLLEVVEDDIAPDDLNKVLAALNNQIAYGTEIQSVNCGYTYSISGYTKACREIPGLLERHTRNSLKAAYIICRHPNFGGSVIVTTKYGEKATFNAASLVPYKTQQFKRELDDIKLNDKAGNRYDTYNKLQDLIKRYFGSCGALRTSRKIIE